MSTASKISLTNTLLLIGCIAADHMGWVNFGLWLPYQWHVFLHLVGVWMFLGNIAVGPVWIMFANKTKDPQTLQFAFRMLLLTDIIVTIPGIDLTVINGLCLAEQYGGFAEQDWLLYSVYGLFALWAFVVPILIIQDKLYALVKKGEVNTAPYTKYFNAWIVVGAISMIPVVMIFYWMVMKNV